MSVRITLLGVPSVTRDGAPVVLDTRKAMALIAHLALGDRPRSREAMCDLLWPGHDAGRARGALRRTLSTVRSAIGEQRIGTAADSVALQRGPGLQIDVDRFRELAAGDSSGELSAAVALFRGAFLEDFALRDSVEFEDWQRIQADVLERELASALRRLVAALTVRGNYEPALAHARRWLALDALHEPAHRELIRLLALTGDRAAALEQYRTCVRTLSLELGVAPLQETAELYEQVNDGLLTVAAQPAADALRALAAVRPQAELPLVGRDRELSALVDAHAAAQPDGRLAVIEGEAGIGKTRLFEELARHAAAAGAVVLSTRCHDDEAGLPYGPVIELLRLALRTGDGAWAETIAPQRLADAALLLPELADVRADVPVPLPLDGPGARVRLLEGVCAVIGAACAGRAPGIVFVDDVHAADEATIDTVAYLGRRLAGRALLLVVSWRSEAVAPGHRLRRVAVAAARSDAATIVAPRRLTRDDVVTLVQATRAEAQTADLEDRVYLQSEGLPLFVVQYLSGATASDAELPADVHGFLTARVAGLGAVARQVLGAAAVIGRSFDVDTLRDASGRGEDELVAALEELMAQDVVREVAGPQPGYDFSHQLLRALVYDETNLARRRLLHRRVAAALSRRSRAGERAPLIAKHLRLAGDDLAAAAQYRIAAERAAELHAHADALKHLDAALALGDADVAGAHERIGDLRTLLGDYGGALTAYGTAAAHAEGDRASIEHKLGNVYHRRGEWGRAEAHLVAALDATGPDQARLRSQIQTDLGHTLQRAGRSEPAAALASEALALAQASGDTLAEAHACNLLGVLARSGGDLDGAAAQLERSADLGGELGDELAQAAALNNLALVRADAGRLAEAHELTVHALAVCVAHGDRHREAALENNLADIEHARGDEDGSREHLRRAIAIFAEIETDESTRLPEIWKLASW